jgi:RNA polymerase sigma factor (sigma-70 family)
MQLALIEEAVNQLPARKKEVFQLLRFEGKSSEEVSQTLGISVQSVKDYLKQATKIIRIYIRNKHTSSHSAAVSILLFLIEKP